MLQSGPKKRGAIAPKGFTRRYGNTITARIGSVSRDGLDACVYRDAPAPVNKAPPTVTKQARPLPGEEYETAKPLPPAEPAQSESAPEAVTPERPVELAPTPPTVQSGEPAETPPPVENEG